MIHWQNGGLYGSEDNQFVKLQEEGRDSSCLDGPAITP